MEAKTQIGAYVVATEGETLQNCETLTMINKLQNEWASDSIIMHMMQIPGLVKHLRMPTVDE